MGERKVPKKREYLNDIQLNENGEYEYVGILHGIDESKGSIQYAKKLIGAYALIMITLYVIAGLVRAVGVMNVMYVTLPYVIGFFMTGVLVYKTASFVFGRYPVRDYHYKATIAKINGYIMATIIFTCCTLLGELLYIILNGIQMYFSGTIIFIACMAGTFAVGCVFKRFFVQLEWKEIPNLAKK